MLAADPGVVYLLEPFNLQHEHGACAVDWSLWFTYICEQNEQQYHEAIGDMVALRYNLPAALRQARGPGQMLYALRRYRAFSKFRRQRGRALLKDPIAVFSVEWLAARFDVQPVVLIRHPAAFAGSMKLKNWLHPFSHFLSQPQLMQNHLSPYVGRIEALSEGGDIIDHAALLWTLIHHMIDHYRQLHPDWIFIRHEDLSRDPEQRFAELYERLSLDYSSNVREVIRSHSKAEGGARFPSQRRDSVSNISAWKRRLDTGEIERLRQAVEPLASVFYSDHEW
jgi:hypothetical protein